MKKIVAAMALIAVLAACGVNPDQARRILEAQGLTQVRIGGYSWLGCAKDDWMSATFDAVGVNGQPVHGVLCQGTFKGITVRFD